LLIVGTTTCSEEERRNNLMKQLSPEVTAKKAEIFKAYLKKVIPTNNQFVWG